MRLNHVGHDIWVGNNDACNVKGHEFDRVIHIWLEKHRAQNWICNAMLSGSTSTNGLSVHWEEGETIASLSAPFADVMNYAAGPGTCMIHCVAGHCRSAQLAVAAKVVRGCEPFQAVEDVARALWTGSRIFPAYRWETMPSILAALEAMGFAAKSC